VTAVQRAGLRSVIIGYGHSGRDLHHRSLRALAARGAAPTGEVLVVDPRSPRNVPDGTRWLPDLPAALENLPNLAAGVFHVTTPIDHHLPVAAALVAAGARHVIVEKPVTRTGKQARQLRLLASTGRTHINAVSVWPASHVTARVAELLASGSIGELVTLHMEQSKPRFRRTLLDCGHHSAFDVELPHQVLLALHIAGPVESLLDVRSWPSPVTQPHADPTTIPLTGSAGGAQLVLRHRNGVISTLLSDLTSPVRTRRLRLTGTTGEITADYPLSADDDFGQISVSGEPNREIVVDQPVTQFIERVYAHAAGVAVPPPEPLDTHVVVIELLEEAMPISASEKAVPC
jgi:predicted dehydrogenase